MQLTITTEPGPAGTTRIRLSGAVDLATRDELLTRCQTALADSHGLVLNLSEVSFMDSTGIGVMIDLSRGADDEGKSFALEEPSHRVQRVLTLTGLQDAWPVAPESGTSTPQES